MLDNRVALVTGGVIGIGKAIGVQLSKNRSKVALASVTRLRLNRQGQI